MKVGELQGGSWLILDGLQPGERVIVDGLQKIQPGMPVRIAQDGAAAPRSSDGAADRGR